MGECACSGLAGGYAFRAVGSCDPSRSGLFSRLKDGLDSVVGGKLKSVEGAFAKDSGFGVLSLEFSSEGMASSSLLAPEELSESTLDRLVTAEDGPVGLTPAAESSGRPMWDGADGLSERDSSVSGTGGLTAGVLIVFVAGGAEVREVISPGGLGSVVEVASTAS